ncbi:MAG: adenosine deaminase [Candidatus Marinimicrobia bacterium]|nr:adenosine deaminase [Candidatus Neomarinimicrobiota bacterium]
MKSKLLDSWYDRIPKVELHLHLEGAIPLDALWTLIQKYGGDSSVQNINALQDKFQFRDFSHFLENWAWKNSFLREYEDFTFISEAIAKDLSNQNLKYVEAFFSPVDFEMSGLHPSRIAESIRTGLSKVSGIEVSLIVDLVRDTKIKKAENFLDQIYEVKELGIIGIGIGGAEHDFPPSRFKDIYQKARHYDFRTTAHAGEAAGADSIWGAIRKLKVDRIGHGTRAFEDESLLDYLAEHQIPLEMCPISNVCTGVIQNIESHPIKEFINRGLAVTVNTDDPKMFNNSLAEEYMNLEKIFELSRKEIQRLILQGIKSSWQSENKKNKLINNFQNNPNWIQD